RISVGSTGDGGAHVGLVDYVADNVIVEASGEQAWARSRKQAVQIVVGEVLDDPTDVIDALGDIADCVVGVAIAVHFATCRRSYDGAQAVEHVRSSRLGEVVAEKLARNLAARALGIRRPEDGAA